MSEDSREPPGEDTAHPELLDWHIAGTLDADRVKEIEAHIDRCAKCRDDVRMMGSLAASMRKYSGTDVFANARNPWRTRFYAVSAAASILLLLLAGSIWLREDPATPTLRPFADAHLTPVSRGAAAATELSGRGPWLLRVTLPFDAPSGRYRVSLEREDRPDPADSNVIAEAEREGSLELFLHLEEPGAYRISVEPADGQDAVGAPFRYRLLLTESRVPR